MSDDDLVPASTKHVIPVSRTSAKLSITLEPSLLEELSKGSQKTRQDIQLAIGEAVVQQLRKVATELSKDTAYRHVLKSPDPIFTLTVEGSGYALDLTDLPTLVAEEARKSIDAVPYGQGHVVIAETTPMNLEKP